MTAKTTLSFTINIRDGVIYDWHKISNNITNCLRNRCSELSINTVKKSKYMPQGIGATGGGFGYIYNFVVMVYHHLGPIYEYLRDNQWLLVVIKNVILFMPNIKNKISYWQYKRRQAKGNYISAPVMDVNIRCDVDSSSYADTYGKFMQVQHAMIEIINVVDEFDASIKKHNPELKLIYNLIAKSIESDSGISVDNMSNINKQKDQIISIINQPKNSVYNFSISVCRSRILYNLKPRLVKRAHVW